MTRATYGVLQELQELQKEAILAFRGVAPYRRGLLFGVKGYNPLFVV